MEYQLVYFQGYIKRGILVSFIHHTLDHDRGSLAILGIGFGILVLGWIPKHFTALLLIDGTFNSSCSDTDMLSLFRNWDISIFNPKRFVFSFFSTFNPKNSMTWALMNGIFTNFFRDMETIKFDNLLARSILIGS